MKVERFEDLDAWKVGRELAANWLISFTHIAGRLHYPRTTDLKIKYSGRPFL